MVWSPRWLAGQGVTLKNPVDSSYVYFSPMTPTVYKVWRVSRASKEALRVSLTRLPKVRGYRGTGQPQHPSSQGPPVPGGEDSDELRSLELSFTFHYHFLSYALITLTVSFIGN